MIQSVTIGSVFSVEGKNILIKVDRDKNLPHLLFKGRAIKNVSAGLSNYVKILKGFTTIICKIEGEYLKENKYQSNKEYSNEKTENRSIFKSIYFWFL